MLTSMPGLLQTFLYKVTHGSSEISASVLFYFNVVPSLQSGFVWASWTLGVEMLFYTAFPLIFSVTRNVRSASIVFVASLFFAMIWRKAVSHWLGPDDAAATFAWQGLLYQLPLFIAGIVIYRIYCLTPDVQWKGRKVTAIIFTLGCFGYIVALTNGMLPFTKQIPFDLVGLSVAYGLLIIGLSLSPLRLLVNPLTRFAGKISYSIYLSHPTIFFLLSGATAWCYAKLPGIGLPFFVAALISLIFIFAFSTVTHRFIEKPGNRLGRKLIERLSSRVLIASKET